MNKILNTLLEFFCGTIVTLIILFFVAKCLIKRLEIRFNKFSEYRINRIEQMIENEAKPKGFFLHTLLMYQDNYYATELYVLIASLELNLSKTERVFLCMKYPDYAKFIK